MKAGYSPRRRGASLLLPGGLLLAASPAFAQAVPDIGDAVNRADQIDQALQQQQQTIARPQAATGDQIDGEAGIYVLTVNDIFYVSGALGGGWSETPNRTADDLGSSAFVNAAATAGVQTTLGGKVDAGIAATVSGIQYAKSFAPSSRGVTLSANVGTKLGNTPLYANLNGFGGFTFDKDFKQGTAFYGVAAALSAAQPLGKRTVLRGGIDGSRQMGEISENNSWNLGASVGVTHLLSPQVAATIEGHVTRVWYDDFYEDVTFVPRHDWNYAASASVTWRAKPWLSVSASGGYAKRDSSFFLSRYHGFEASLVLSVVKRF